VLYYIIYFIHYNFYVSYNYDHLPINPLLIFIYLEKKNARSIISLKNERYFSNIFTTYVLYTNYLLTNNSKISFAEDKNIRTFVGRVFNKLKFLPSLYLKFYLI